MSEAREGNGGAFAGAKELRGPILIFGSGGQVGSCWMELLGGAGRAGGVGNAIGTASVVGVDYPEVDLTRKEHIEAALEKHRPQIVINAAAYTAVDQAESDQATAMLVNAEAPGIMARWCAQQGASLIHYSTDYVYDEKGGPHLLVESAVRNPVNFYGRSKLAGDEAVEAAGGRYLIFRTSWVFHEKGKNFVLTMLRKGETEETLRVVGDQVGGPTYARHLAMASLEALGVALAREEKEAALAHEKKTAAEAARRGAGGGNGFPSGVYHLCGSGETSWHGFAEAIFEEGRKLGFPLRVREVQAIRSEDFVCPARRPGNSRMDCSLAARTFGVRMPHWREALRECLGALKHLRSK